MPALVHPQLRTPRLELRPLRASDAADLHAVFSDAKVMRYWSTAPWTRIEQASDTIDQDLRQMSTGDYLRLGVELTETHSLVGTCTLFDIHPTCRRAELGYGLASTAWGRGYMHEALTALLEYGFTELGLHRVEADVDPRNAASVRALERLGFVREGLLRERWIVGTEISDTLFYGLLNREWRARS